MKTSFRPIKENRTINKCVFLHFRRVVKGKMQGASKRKVFQSGCEGQKEGGQPRKTFSKRVLKDKMEEVSKRKVFQGGFEGQNTEGKQEKSPSEVVLKDKTMQEDEQEKSRSKWF